MPGQPDQPVIPCPPASAGYAAAIRCARFRRSRSEGQGRAAEIRGQKECDVLAASSVGYRSAQDLKGKADARAVAIYARAYGQVPGFYEFWKSMETLQMALDRDATLILSTDSDLLKYLKDSKGR